jgi:N-acetylmuramoyl-L-alanine amidase
LVLWRTKMPSVLVELGFLSHPKEENFLITDSGQDYLASAIFRAFRDHKKNVEARSNFISEANSPSKEKSLTISPKPSTTSKPSISVPTNQIPVATSSPELNSTTKPSSVTSNNAVQFRVQITSSSKSIPIHSPYFKKLDGIEEVLIGGIYKYFVGNKSTYTEIIDFSIQIKELFPDAFVVAFMSGEQIPLDQAKKLSSQ